MFNFGDKRRVSENDQQIQKEQMKRAQGMASVVKNILSALEVYQTRQGSLLRPQTLGYIYGWCDATTQVYGCEHNSTRSFAWMTGMFVSIYDKKLLLPDGDGDDDEPGIVAFKGATALLKAQNSTFIDAMMTAGNEVFAYLNDGETPVGMIEAFS